MTSIRRDLIQRLTIGRQQCFEATTYARVSRSVGLLIEAVGLRAPVGQLCWIEHREAEIPCEVVGFDDQTTLLMPLARTDGVDPGTQIRIPNKHQGNIIADPRSLLGRTVNGLGEPIDGLGPVTDTRQVELVERSINPMTREPISERLDTGVVSINALLSVGVGQRVGLFAGSGVGKSVLLGMLARFVKADVVVVGLIGERGREVQEFVRDNLGDGLSRAVVVASPADDSAAMRLRGAFLATHIAEVFRDQGKRVLLLMDSLTRVAQAQREIGLSMGEPPTSKGYTPSSFAYLPRLVERAGMGEDGKGSISAFYTVLMEEDDLQDPVVDAARAILDGHIVLSRRLAEQGIYPAIDISRSISRVMNNLVEPAQAELARRFKMLWAKYEEQEDLISVGAYRAGSDPHTDEAIERHQLMCDLLKQDAHSNIGIPESLDQLQQMFVNQPASPISAVEVA